MDERTNPPTSEDIYRHWWEDLRPPLGYTGQEAGSSSEGVSSPGWLSRL